MFAEVRRRYDEKKAAGCRVGRAAHAARQRQLEAEQQRRRRYMRATRKRLSRVVQRLSCWEADMWRIATGKKLAAPPHPPKAPHLHPAPLHSFANTSPSPSPSMPPPTLAGRRTAVAMRAFTHTLTVLPFSLHLAGAASWSLRLVPFRIRRPKNRVGTSEPSDCPIDTRWQFRVAEQAGVAADAAHAGRRLARQQTRAHVR